MRKIKVFAVLFVVLVVAQLFLPLVNKANFATFDNKLPNEVNSQTQHSQETPQTNLPNNPQYLPSAKEEFLIEINKFIETLSKFDSNYCFGYIIDNGEFKQSLIVTDNDDDFVVAKLYAQIANIYLTTASKNQLTPVDFNLTINNKPEIMNCLNLLNNSIYKLCGF